MLSDLYYAIFYFVGCIFKLHFYNKFIFKLHFNVFD